jgi:hypothetical protein
MVAKKKPTHVIEAMTPSSYSKVRDPYIEKLKKDIAEEETEAQRQKRLYIEENLRKQNDSLADE